MGLVRSQSLPLPAVSGVRTLTPARGGGSHPADFVHVTLIAEAYTAAEADVFFADAARLVHECFLAPGAAFASLMPLLAVHAVHAISDSGALPIEYGRSSGGGGGNLRGAAALSTTAFGLRREDGPLRTVAPPGSGRKAYALARAVCGAWAPGCDHVLLVAHDPWYGGLGDAVAIFTSSATSGALALRHELGHILADVRNGL